MPTSESVARIAERARASPARCGATRLVCIDGPAGSGKSTLAAALAAELGPAPVVHMDDMYEGWSQQLGAPLSARIEAWLLRAWEVGLPGRYLHYDWAAGRYVRWVEVPAAPVVVLEGCASASREIRPRASLVVWVQAPREICLQRGLTRDGGSLAQHWQAWQAHETAHFTEDRTRTAADALVDGVSGRLLRR